jgi:20S proteasome alpha/beta subunit
MSLVAGCKCRDGFVLAADTEITYGTVVYQDHKLFKYFSEKCGYSLVIGGAGDASYLTMAAQKIRDAADAQSNPHCNAIRDTAERTILEIHDTALKYWNVDDQNRPSIELLVGVKDGAGKSQVFKIDRTAVLEIESWAFIGSGSTLAAHLAEKMYGAELSAAVTVNLISQIFREVKSKGTYVGGNTEIVATRNIGSQSEPFFQLTNRDNRFLWGLDDVMQSAIRIALDKDKSTKALDKRIRQIVKTLRELRRDADRERGPGISDTIHVTEFGSEYGNQFKDL